MTVNINGDLSQWTLGTVFVAAASGQMVADGFRLHKSGTAVHTIRKSDDVPHWRIAGRDIHASLEVEVTTADATVASTDVTAIVYRGEASEMAELIGDRVRVRLWLKGTPGVYGIHLSNGDETLSYNQLVRVDENDKWTPCDVWVPWQGVDDDWFTKSPLVGYSVAVILMAGTNFHGELDKWHSHAASAFKFSSIEQSNFNATVGNRPRRHRTKNRSAVI